MRALARTHRRLAVLTEVGSGRKVTQRSLAAALGVSLGLAHGLLCELKSAGLITVRRASAARALHYGTTKAGRAEAVRLTVELAREFGPMLTGLRVRMQRRAAKAAARGRRRALLCGEGPLADMAASAILNAGMKLAGVVSAAPDAGRVAGIKVRPMAEAYRIRCDLRVALTGRDAKALRKHLGGRVPMAILLPDATGRRAVRGS